MLRILMPAPREASGPMPRLADLLADGLRLNGCDVTIVPWGGGGGRGLSSRVVDRIGEVVVIRRTASAMEPDLLLVQTSHDWVCVIRDLALSVAVPRRNRKLVLEFHGSRADVLSARGRLPFKLATRLLLRRVDGVFVLSSEERRALEAFERHGRFRVVTNPFVPPPGLDRGTAARDGDPRAAPVVLFASRLLPEKGVIETVEAFSALRERIAARLVVAGDGPAAAEVARIVRERGLSDDVTVTGHLPSEQLAASYLDADVFVLPTYHPEGFPTAISEAMSAGLPVVTTKLRGNADHLVEETNALFVPPRDAAAITAALERLLSDADLRARMSNANRKKVKQFAPRQVAREYVAALDGLVSPSKSGVVQASEAAPSPELLVSAARDAFELGARLDWKSHDPYDLLLSPFGHMVQVRSWLAARVVVQVGRRSGTAVRRLLHVPPHQEPKALADFLGAAALLAAAGETWAAAYAPELAGRLRTSSTATAAGRGWGLCFPYASRFVNVESGMPNLYVTAAACQALLDYHDLTYDVNAMETAVEGCRFIVDGLGRFEHRGHCWLRYWRGLDSPLVNVQASGARVLARVGTASGEERLLEYADTAAAAALAAQRPDGSWPYSDDGRADFVDGFHTGFTLQGLAGYAAVRGPAAVDGVAEAVGAGFEYFVDHLLTVDGLPRGLADGKTSLDGQNVAQCIQTLVVCARGAHDLSTARQLWRRAVERLLTGPSRTPDLRWTIAPAVLATAYLATSANSSE